MKHIVERKLVTTYFTTALICLLLTFLYLDNRFSEPNLGNKVMGLSFFYMFYVGPIVLLYGNLVSIGIEFLQNKWGRPFNWLYVLLHGIFGLANGLFFRELNFAFSGMVAALLYATIDRWLFYRRKGLKLFILIPIILYGLTWGTLQLLSPPLPPFTEEDAVELATNVEGTIIEFFPKEIGKWEGRIDGYRVTRETSLEEIGNEKYVVTFTETWEKGNNLDTWYLSYEVERGTLSLQENGGEIPPYYD